ncbi:HNH endonuclease [Chitinophaga sp. sic0106]|uniref:HNH endonuclease n=1 Tax=Chitinophaga sp. sic0106 TaxID=2854785 RepID=UPI001C473069|nr:HNH endonuclease [Chitinophaga sp. sic0106]MBV7529639.1 HNH endonuclease [Chitinophaga sp. sic0106]
MRPVLMNQNPSYTIPALMKTQTAAIIQGLTFYAIQPVSGNGTTNTYNTGQVLNQLATLTAQNGGAAKWANLPPTGKSLVESLILYFSNNDTMKYGNARGSLIQNYGEYCSYCGMPVQDSALAIEHCLPKSVFPSEMLYYTNFFLACPSCNTQKGDKPSWADSVTWATRYNGAPTNLAQVMAGGMDRQVWPTNANMAWAGLPMVFYNLNSNTILSNNSALDLGNRLVGVSQNIVTAKIIGFAQALPVAAQVGTNPGGNSPNQAQFQAMEDNFIDIVKLNLFEADNYSDRRVTNRTLAWLSCITSLSNLSAFTAGSEGWYLMLGQIFQTAKNAGFFEVWSWIFYWISGPSAQFSVYMIFRNVSCDPTQPLYYFPGTNQNALPTT